MGKQARDSLVQAADAAISGELAAENKGPFPPLTSGPLQDVVMGAWRSFLYLQQKRNQKGGNGDLDLACAEHYAFARALSCAGGVFMAITTVDLAVLYQIVKVDAQSLDKILGALLGRSDVGILQLVGYLFSLGAGRTTPPSAEQLAAAADGAADGLALQAFSVLGGN